MKTKNETKIEASNKTASKISAIEAKNMATLAKNMPKAVKPSKRAMKLAVKLADKIVKPATTKPVKAPAKPVIGDKAQAASVHGFAVQIAEGWQKLAEACKGYYGKAYSAWAVLMDLPKVPTVENVNAFHKVFRPELVKATGWAETTCKARCSEWRKAAGFPQVESQKNKGGGGGSRGSKSEVDTDAGSAANPKGEDGKDVISITLNSASAKESSASLKLALGKLAMDKVYGRIACEAMRDVLAKVDGRAAIAATLAS